MRSKRILVLFFFIGGFVLLAFSHSVAQEAWSLEKCLEYAYQNSPRIKAELENQKQAEGEAQAASSILFPQLSFSMSYTRNSPAPFSSFAGAPSGRIRPSLISADVYESGLGVNYNIFSFKTKPTLEISSASIDLAQADVKKVKNELSLQVKLAFYTVLFNQQLVEVAQGAEDVARNNYETTEKLYKEGKVSHFDVSRAKVRWVNSKTDLIITQNNLNISKENLRAVLSLPADQVLEVSGQFSDQIVEVDLNTSLQTARTQRPEIFSSDFREKLSKSTIQLEKATRLPSFSLSYNYSWQGGNLYSEPDRYYKTWSFLGKVTLPLFDGFTAKGRIKAAKASWEQSKQQREALLDGINLEVRQAFSSLKAAQERILAQKENVETSQENLRIATERYKLGLLSQLELKDAELSLIESQTNYIKALYDYNLALAALDKAQGKF